MIKIAICDSESQALEHAQALLAKYAHEHSTDEIVTCSFEEPTELIKHVNEYGGFDILLLDLGMTDALGSDAARMIRRLGDDGEIIFLTNSSELPEEEIKVYSMQRLLKPYREPQLFEVLNQILKRVHSERRDTVVFKTCDGIARLAPRDVMFTEKRQRDHQVIHTVQGNTLEVSISSPELFELLSTNKYFVACDGVLNLNLKYVRQVSRDLITFETGEVIACPAQAYRKLENQLLHLQS